MRIKPIAFDIHGAAKFSLEETKRHIRDITLNTYDIEIDLSGHEFQNYYRPDGAKITKTLTTLLRKQLNKEDVAERFASYGKRISELYTTGVSLVAYFGDKKKLGKGEYENKITCFSDGHENAICREFLVRYKRAAVLCLESAEGKAAGRGRCLVFFAGGRNITMTNFYYHGLTQNKLYFIEAIRRLFNLKQVIYRKNSKFFLPIYLNKDSVHVYDARSQRQYLGRKLPCPNCGKVVEEEHFYYRQEGDIQILGCSEKCAIKHSKVMGECNLCEAIVNPAQMVGFEGKLYCKECWNKNTYACGKCGNRYMGEPTVTKDKEIRCPNCYKNSGYQCKGCGDRYAKPHRMIETQSKGCFYCLECVTAGNLYCVVCRTAYDKSLNLISNGRIKRAICDECLTPVLEIPDSRDPVVAVA